MGRQHVYKTRGSAESALWAHARALQVRPVELQIRPAPAGGYVITDGRRSRYTSVRDMRRSQKR